MQEHQPHNPQPPHDIPEVTESSVLDSIQKDIEKEQKQLIQQIRNIKNTQTELETNQQLTETIINNNQLQIKEITKNILILENQLQLLSTLRKQNDNLTSQQYHQTLSTTAYHPSQQALTLRYNELIASHNNSNWTDATDSQVDNQQIWVVDDEIVQAMLEDQAQEIKEEEEDQEQDDNVPNHKNQQSEEMNLQKLQEQFVTGQPSDHQVLFGRHDKFCVSVNGHLKGDLLLSGGGDDYLYMYHFPKQQTDKDKCLHPYHIIKHSETVNKIQLSSTKQHIFTMTDNEILCTEIKTLSTTTLKSQQPTKKPINNQKINPTASPSNTQNFQNKQEQQSDSQSNSQNPQPICSDMVCHHLGDVVAVASGFELQIYNIKGLKLYQTYYCDKPIDTFLFTQTGKQIVMACDDHRLRLLTPKTSEIAVIAGHKQHKAEISALKTKGDIVLSGCIEGRICVTSIKKSAITALIETRETEDIDAPINQLQFAGSSFIVGSTLSNIDWYDLCKTKKLFQSVIEGSPSDICWQSPEFPHLYNISTINGAIHIFDCRNPLKEAAHTRAGNTIHKLWCDGCSIAAACEDGHLRLFDIRRLF